MGNHTFDTPASCKVFFGFDNFFVAYAGDLFDPVEYMCAMLLMIGILSMLGSLLLAAFCDSFRTVQLRHVPQASDPVSADGQFSLRFAISAFSKSLACLIQILAMNRTRPYGLRTRVPGNEAVVSCKLHSDSTVCNSARENYDYRWGMTPTLRRHLGEGVFV